MDENLVANWNDQVRTPSRCGVLLVNATSYRLQFDKEGGPVMSGLLNAGTDGVENTGADVDGGGRVSRRVRSRAGEARNRGCDQNKYVGGEARKRYMQGRKVGMGIRGVLLRGGITGKSNK